MAMSPNPRRASILVVDDERDIRELVELLLRRAGHEVRTAADGRAAMRAFHADPPDLVILDITMPELDGWQTLERIRDLGNVPVLVLTAHSAELERVRGLRAGSDDYVIKPFGRQELIARVDALLRRTRDTVRNAARYSDGAIEVDFAGSGVTLHGAAVALTPLEFRLLSAFVRHPAQVLSRDQLIELSWNDPVHVSSDQVKLYVGYLRAKIGSDRIETVRGFGYRYLAAA